MQNNDTKFVYSQIINGYSSFLYKNKTFYIKHLNNLDLASIDIFYNNAIEYAVSRHIPTQKDRLETLIQNKQWSNDKEKEIEEIKAFIVSLKHTKTKYSLAKDKKLVDKEIVIHQDRLTNLILERNKLIGKTAEQYADKKINEYYLYISLYKDDKLNHQYYSQGEFDELEQIELDNLLYNYNKTMTVFSDNYLKKISLMPIFMNLYRLSNNNAYNFYGKPLIYITFYQIEIFQHAKHFDYILNNATTQPPPEILNEPDKLYEWFENSKNMENVIQNSDAKVSNDNDEVISGSSIVGAKSEDYKKYGINGEENKSLMEKLKKKGELSVFDIMNA